MPRLIPALSLLLALPVMAQEAESKPKLSVVPDPEQVMAEMARVVKPGGRVVIVNHFASKSGAMAWRERRMAVFDDILAWQTVFPRERVMGQPQLSVEREARFPPFGVMTLLVLRKAA